MSWKLETVSQLRPCYVDGVKALFHNWGGSIAELSNRRQWSVEHLEEQCLISLAL